MDPHVVVVRVTRTLKQQQYVRAVKYDEYVLVSAYLKGNRYLSTDVDVLGNEPRHVDAHRLLFGEEVWPGDDWIQLVEAARKKEREYAALAKQRAVVERRQAAGQQCITHTPYSARRKDADAPYDSICTVDALQLAYDILPADFAWDRVQAGHLIDLEGYRGLGVWYFDGKLLHKTRGEYGYFLPDVAFEKVKEHGLGYFEEYVTPCEYICIPRDVVIQRNGKRIRNNGEYALALNRGDDTGSFLLDGRTFSGALVEFG